MRRVSETLSGRATYLVLWHLTRREQLGFGATGPWTQLLAARDRDWSDILAADPAPPESWQDLARRGGYPPAAFHPADDDAPALWFAGYTTTYLERHLQEPAAIRHPADLR